MGLKKKPTSEDLPLWKTLPWLTIAITLVYAGFFTWLFWGRLCGFFTASNTQLNQIGDFLAGMFAPLAVLWLVAAVLVQKQELAAAKKQSEDSLKQLRKQVRLAKSATRDQIELSAETAKANYRIAVFDKRVSIYNRLIDAARSIHRAGDIEMDAVRSLFELNNESRLVFGDAVNALMTAVDGYLENILDAEEKRLPLSQRKREVGLNPKEEEEFKAQVKIKHDNLDAIYKLTAYKELESLFEPLIKLPDEIELPRKMKDRTGA